jgi:arylsulfatase A-like enzyme
MLGLGFGTLLGLIEGITALVSNGQFGRYNDLVPWAILFDASTLTAVELLAAVLIQLPFLYRRHLPSARVLVVHQIDTAGLLLFHRQIFSTRTRATSPQSRRTRGTFAGPYQVGALVPLQLGISVFLITIWLSVWRQWLSNPSLSTSDIQKNIVTPAIVGAALGTCVLLLCAWLATHSIHLPDLRARYWLGTGAIVWLATLGFGLNLSLPNATPQQAVLATDSKPQFNVLIITGDALRADHLGLYGNATVKTPNLDRLGQSGTWFTTAIVQQPNTNASHTSIFTGVFPFVHGVRQHMIDRLAPDVQTLAEVLGQRGYQTAGLYSWVSLEKGFSGLRGFQTYEDLSIHLTSTLRDPRFQNLIVTYRLLGKYLFLPGVIENSFLQGAQNSVEDTTDGKANVTTDAALRWLDANASKPFFLWVHYYDPHYPYTPPPPFDTMYDPDYTGSVDGDMPTIHYIFDHNTGKLTGADVNHLRALYAGEVSFSDQQLGRLVDEVDRLGLRENTIVVMTGDHGEGLGNDGRWFHGSQLYYAEIHVPLIIRFPPAIPANRSIKAPVESIDIMPTILDLLKIPVPAGVQGTSLLPWIAGSKQSDDAVAITMLDTYKQISLLNSQWHLIWNRRDNTSELYDYHADPLETDDQASQHPDVAAQLLQRLHRGLSDLHFPNP